MEKSTEEYRNYWDEKVQQDGDYPEYLSPGGNHHLFKAFTPIIQHLPKNKKVLDIGCGSGFSTYFYYPFCTQLVGVDYSAEAIKKATEKYPHITFVQSDVTALPFKDREFDVIICQGVLHHLIKSTNRLSSNLVYNAIQEIDRVGKGLILVDEANALNPLRRYKERIYYPYEEKERQSDCPEARIHTETMCARHIVVSYICRRCNPIYPEYTPIRLHANRIIFTIPPYKKTRPENKLFHPCSP